MSAQRELASSFFSPHYCFSASTDRVAAVKLAHKGIGLVALQPLRRKYVCAYYPAVVRRARDVQDATYALTVYDSANRLLSKWCADLPTNDESEDFQPQWRKKPVLGHIVNEPDADADPNAHICFPVVDEPESGELYYVPIQLDRDVDAGEEIVVHYGSNYNRDRYEKPNQLKRLLDEM
jgi:hypothetical protein